MTVATGLIRAIGGAIAALAILCLLAPAAVADCARDSSGEVYCGAGRCAADRAGVIWCSRYFEGGVERTQDGTVVCGKGHCAKDSRGQVFCSSEVAGAVGLDSAGHVRCYGRCEAATAAQCEHTRAGSSG